MTEAGLHQASVPSDTALSRFSLSKGNRPRITESIEIRFVCAVNAIGNISECNKEAMHGAVMRASV